ncbi:MAG: hypothetical protein ABJE10_05000, partial [bacterium]
MPALASPVAHDLARRDVIAPAQRSTEMSPQAMARWGAALLLATIIGGVFAQGFLSDRLVVAGDAAATA